MQSLAAVVLENGFCFVWTLVVISLGHSAVFVLHVLQARLSAA